VVSVPVVQCLRQVAFWVGWEARPVLLEAPISQAPSLALEASEASEALEVLAVLEPVPISLASSLALEVLEVLAMLLEVPIFQA
jgi:hypothetical protein